MNKLHPKVEICREVANLLKLAAELPDELDDLECTEVGKLKIYNRDILFSILFAIEQAGKYVGDLRLK
jgi:hypothetical protein